MASPSESNLPDQSKPLENSAGIIRREFIIEGYRSYHKDMGDVIAEKPQQESWGWWPGTRDDYVDSLISMQQIIEGMIGLQRYKIKITFEAKPLGEPET